MASELSRFIDEELLKEGKEGELAKLLAKQNTQRAKARRPAFLGFCSPRSICCLLIFAVVAAAVIATAQKSEAPKKVIGWARSKGKGPSSGSPQQEPLPFPGKHVGQTNVAVSHDEPGPDVTQHSGSGDAAQPQADAAQTHADAGQQPKADEQPAASAPVPAPEPEMAPAPAPGPEADAPAPAPESAAKPGPEPALSPAATQHPFADASQPAVVPEAVSKPFAAVPAPAPEPSTGEAGGTAGAPSPAPAQEASALDRVHKARRRSGAGRKLLAC